MIKPPYSTIIDDCPSSTYTINETDTTSLTNNTDLQWGWDSTATSGQILSVGVNGITSGWSTIAADPNLQGSTLNVKGNAEFEGDLIIKGKSINDSLERIEERLAILRPNEELEAKWENLRGLRKAYMELEAEIIEKEMIWKTLKK